MPAKSTRPPGPRGWPLFGVALELRPDPLGYFARMARDYGDIVRVPLPFYDRFLLNHPDFIEQVLVIQHQKFHKSDFAKKATARLLGAGLLTSEGDFWRRQRRLVQPGFHRARIFEYSESMTEMCLAHIRSWRDGDERDIAAEMSRLTLAIAVKTLFGAQVKDDAERVGRELATVMRYELARLRFPIWLPESWPWKVKHRAEQAYRFLDSLVFQIVEERRAQPSEGADLLSMLIAAMDEDGSQMTPQQLRDETMTLFLAGHETTALTLAWAFYLLGENPEAESRLHAEVSNALGGRVPFVADLDGLPYLDAVIREVLRLYPPAYALGRTSTEPFEVGGYHFPARTTVLMLPWVMHRDPRFFDEPERFRPERWLDGLAARLPAHAYFPFGGGPRRCIGQGFALMEAALVLATIAQRFAFRLVAGQPVVPEPLVTLRPKHGLRMLLRTRT